MPFLLEENSILEAKKIVCLPPIGKFYIFWYFNTFITNLILKQKKIPKKGILFTKMK